MNTVAAALAAAAGRLRAGSTSADLDAGLLLARVLGCTRGTLAARGARPLAPGERAAFEALLERRAAGEPIAYLTGRREFWSLDLAVTRDVLVPRPETELLVERALAALAGRPAPAVLDLGTGSGAIALAIATERADATVVAVDDSAAALEVARANAAAAGVAVQFLCGHWYRPLAGRRFDAVLSNPPYLAESDPHLPSLAFEPRAALVAGPTGLEAIERILAAAGDHLAAGGFVAVEHGADQGAEVRGLCGASGLRQPVTHRDLAGLERVTLALSPAPASAAG